MFEKILVALDGSDHATKALKIAVEMAQRCDSELILFYALEVRSLRADYEAIVNKSARDAYLAMGEKQTDCIRRNHSSAEPEPRTSGVHSTPQNPLLQRAVMKS